MHALLGPPPFGIAHRGGAALWPENTFRAFQGALGHGITRIETDAHLTRDGVVVLSHDPSLARCAGVARSIMDLTWREVQRADAGATYSPDGGMTFPFRNQGLGVPRLDDVLGTFPGAGLTVDLKARDDGALARAVWEVIRRACAEDRVAVGSFSSRRLAAFRACSGGRVPTGAGTREAASFATRAAIGLAGRDVHEYRVLALPGRTRRWALVTARLVEQAHAAGLQVHVWTVDDPAEMRRLFQLGVDAVMSDRPDTLAAVLAAPQ